MLVVVTCTCLAIYFSTNASISAINFNKIYWNESKFNGYRYFKAFTLVPCVGNKYY